MPKISKEKSSSACCGESRKSKSQSNTTEICTGKEGSLMEGTIVVSPGLPEVAPENAESLGFLSELISDSLGRLDSLKRSASTAILDYAAGNRQPWRRRTQTWRTGHSDDLHGGWYAIT
jgi:hypothetical protein